MRTNVVGRGLMPKPTVDADVLKISPEKAREIERKISKEWELWAESADCDMAMASRQARDGNIELRLMLFSF